jgi:hypothetical protein
MVFEAIGSSCIAVGGQTKPIGRIHETNSTRDHRAADRSGWPRRRGARLWG